MIKKENIFSTEEKRKDLFDKATASISESLDKLDIKAINFNVFKDLVELIESEMLSRIIDEIEKKEEVNERNQVETRN